MLRALGIEKRNGRYHVYTDGGIYTYDNLFDALLRVITR